MGKDNEISRKNLISANQKTPEQLREMQRKGVEKRKENFQKRKMLKECINILLEKEMTNKKGEKVTGAEAMSIKMFEKALKGDTKAWELIRDTAGQKPVEKVQSELTEVIIDLGKKQDNEE